MNWKLYFLRITKDMGSFRNRRSDRKAEYTMAFMINNTLMLCAALIMITAAGGNCQDSSKIGGFDISKVREEAVKDAPNLAGDSSLQVSGQKNARESEGMLIVILRITGYLAIIVVVIFSLLWGIRKLGLAGSSGIGGGSMDVLEVLPLGQNRSIILVRVTDAVMVLAQTSQQITLLEKIEGQKAVELIASTKGGTSIVQFKEVFNSFIGKIKKTS